MIDPDRIYTVPEAAALIGCSIAALRRACHTGRLQSFRAGYGVYAPFRIRGQALKIYVAQRKPVHPNQRGPFPGAGRPKKASQAQQPSPPDAVLVFPDHGNADAVAVAFGLNTSCPARAWATLPAEQFAAKVNEWLRRAL